MTKYAVGVTVLKEFNISFPDSLFTPEHMQGIRDYCEYNRDITEEDLKFRIIEAWANSESPGYFEQFGAYIGYYLPCSYIEEGVPFVEISNPDSEVDDIYMEQA